MCRKYEFFTQVPLVKKLLIFTPKTKIGLVKTND